MSKQRILNRILNKEPQREETVSTHDVPEIGWSKTANGMMMEIKLTQGRWKCVICGKWQNYIVVNGHVVSGCGAASHSLGGNRIEHCAECSEVASALLHEAEKIDDSDKKA